jgi:hypothetical protein
MEINLNCTSVHLEVGILSEHLFIQQLFVQNNVSYKKREKLTTFPCIHPEGSCVSQCVIIECMHSAQDSGLCEWNHCETASCISTSFGICDCQDLTKLSRWHPCCSNSDGSVLNIRCIVLTAHEVTSLQ